MEFSLFITPTHPVPSHLDRVEKRGQAAGHADLCAGNIVPTDGDFQRSITEVPGDVEHFHIEAETVQRLAAENLARRGALEQFETALRVVERQAGNHTHREIEELTDQLAEPRLMHADQGPIERPKADSRLRVLLVDGVPKSIQLFDGSRKVGVRQE